MVLAWSACSSTHPKSVKSQSKSVIIDLDEEVRLKASSMQLRDSQSTILIDEPIYIGDNDEVSFKGDFMQESSPMTITIGNKDSITFSGKSFTIKTSDLKDGEKIQIRDQAGKIFVDVAVSL